MFGVPAVVLAVPYVLGDDVDALFDVPVAVFDDPVVVFDVPYELLVFDALLVCVLWLFDADFVSPRMRLIMSFQLVVEHPPSATSNAPATAVMRKFDVLI